MGRFLLFLLGLVLIVVGVLAGGCSVLFTPSLFGTGEFEGTGNLPIWGAGVLVGIGGIWIGIKAFRASMRDPREASTESDGKTPPEPPEGNP